MSREASKTGDRTPRDGLVYGGICPVCGEEFIDGYDRLEEGESYEARICVDEIDGEGEGKMLVHIKDDEGSEQTPQEEWEAHNESFSYEPPEKPGDAWSSEEYQELNDRFISRRTEWFCDKCTGKGPMSSLQKARSHVQKQHGVDLVQKYETPRDELEAETDGGKDESKTAKQAEENHGLGDFSGGDSQ